VHSEKGAATARQVRMIRKKFYDAVDLDVRAVFRKFDEEGDGILGVRKFEQALVSLPKINLSPLEVRELVSCFDGSGYGEVDGERFCQVPPIPVHFVHQILSHGQGANWRPAPASSSRTISTRRRRRRRARC
jgi:hypothetical protein